MFQGVLASLVASCMFGGIYYLSPLLVPLNGEQVFGWRMLAVLPFTTVLLWYSGQWPAVRAIVVRAAACWPLGLGLVLGSAMFGAQVWLFVWAPLHGHALPVSLGYFLMPLVMVLIGRVLYGERLSAWQRAAAALAAAGVLWELWRAGGMAWSTWAVALGYPLYFVLRRRMGTDSLAGHWLDVVLMLPVCLWCALWGVPGAWDTMPGWQAVVQTPALPWLVLLMGVSSAVALALYMSAHRRLPLGLFGLLSYVEPVLMAVVALLLGERVQPGQEVMYALVAAAVLMLAVQGVLQLRKGPAAGG